MTRRLRMNIILMCVICLLGSLLCGYAAMEDDLPEEETVLYQKIPICVDGNLEYSGYMVDQTTYIPFRSFCGALNLGAVVTWDEETQEATGRVEDYTISASADRPYIVVNGRYFYVPTGTVMYRGTLLVPLRLMCDAFSIDVEWDQENGMVNLVMDQMQVCQSGDNYYQADDVYWLSRIINAEAGNQPLEGKISVGNVVMNRAEREGFPDTIQGVIFDTTYGIQFDPVRSGSIYMEPNEESVLAAKLCLDGCEMAGDSLYFVNPAVGSTSWFRNTRTFVASIGDHDFYA